MSEAEKGNDFIDAAETLERAAVILRMMAEEDSPVIDAVTEGYNQGRLVDVSAVRPPADGSQASLLHVEPGDWPEGERNEHTAEAAHATHDWDAEKQDCRKCGIPHPVFVAQGWPVCQG